MGTEKLVEKGLFYISTVTDNLKPNNLKLDNLDNLKLKETGDEKCGDYIGKPSNQNRN